MNGLNELIRRIEKENYHSFKREIFPIDTYSKKMDYSIKILLAAYRSFKRLKNRNKKYTLLKEARKNFVINCVTATEVYFKDLIKTTPELSKDIKSIAVKELLSNKGKVNLWEAYEIFHEKDFRIGEILTYFYTFQNIEDINIVMSKLLSVNNFLSEVELHKLKLHKDSIKRFHKEEISLSEDFPNWKTLIADIFNLRHDYVHHINFKDKLGDEKLFKYYETLDVFISVTDDYFFEHVKMDESKK